MMCDHFNQLMRISFKRIWGQNEQINDNENRNGSAELLLVKYGKSYDIEGEQVLRITRKTYHKYNEDTSRYDSTLLLVHFA